MRFFHALCIGALLFPCMVFAHSGAYAAGVTPESPLYFFDRLGETIAELFAFTPAARARLEHAFAAERIAEIKTMLEVKGIASRGIPVAEAALAEHWAASAALAARERHERNDASARAIDDGVRQTHAALAQALSEHKHALEQKEKELHDASETTNDADERSMVEQAIERVKTEKEMTDAKISEYEMRENGTADDHEHASSTDSIFGENSDVRESEKERLMRSIESVEDEIKRTEEFLRQKKEEKGSR